MTRNDGKCDANAMSNHISFSEVLQELENVAAELKSEMATEHPDPYLPDSDETW